VSLSANTLATVARWYAELDPVRTQTLLCRLHSRQLIKDCLTRERVAALPIDVVNELLGIGRAAIDHAESRAMTPEDSPENRDIVNLARGRLEAGIELLARLAIRLPSADASQLLTRALHLYRSTVVGASPSLQKDLGLLFTSLLGSMSVEDISNRLSELMALPIPGSSDFPVRFPGFWPDVMFLLPEKVLSELQGRASAGWMQRIRAYLLGSDIHRFRTRHVQPDGRETWGYATEVDDAFLIDWHNATARTLAQRASNDRRYLDWTLTEVSTLFEKLRIWWEDEGRAVLAASRAGSPFPVPMLGDSLRERVERVLAVLRDVVVPRVTQRNRLANQIVAFVEELELCEQSDRLVRGTLLVAGFQQHARGSWRFKRGRKPTNPEE
jgi:hypothetical protein